MPSAGITAKQRRPGGLASRRAPGFLGFELFRYRDAFPNVVGGIFPMDEIYL